MIRLNRNCRSAPSLSQWGWAALFFLLTGWRASVGASPGPALIELAERSSAEDVRVIPGIEGWFFFQPEIRHMAAGRFWGEAAAAVSRATRPDAADPLPAILAFHQALAERGVRLVLVPVPPKAAVYPHKLSEKLADKDVETVHSRFYDLLRDHGVVVLDLLSFFREQRGHGRGPLYCRHDTHWSGVACVLAAAAIAQKIGPHLELQPSLNTEAEWCEVEIKGDLVRMLDAPPDERERLMLRKIRGKNGEKSGLVAPDPHSPVVLLGDSHALVFHDGDDMHARGAGLADQLAHELGIAVDLVAVRGSGATPARINLFRRARRDVDYWQNKAVVIWCFSVREFTESDGWRTLPVAP